MIRTAPIEDGALVFTDGGSAGMPEPAPLRRVIPEPSAEAET
jgi:hypothetical protein